MHAIVVWMDAKTPAPSVIGPYSTDLAFDDAELLKDKCYKIQVCNITSPDKSETLKLLSQPKKQ